MGKFNNRIKSGIGDPSSKYAYDKDGKQFEADMQRHIDNHEKLYAEFKTWMISHEIDPNKFRGLFHRYYDEFISEV